jgi:uncharacterized membrane protein
MQTATGKSTVSKRLQLSNQMLWLGLWIALGLVLRFTNLTAKPPWTDEFATIVFSLGKSFQTVPLDQVLPLEQLMSPLHPDPSAGAGDVVRYLMTESNHPPLYYLLTHYWLKLFPTEHGLASLWGARSLSALFGVAAIPATFGLAWLAFRSSLVAQMATALMAVSPFAIYLAQEARHYTLAMLWIIASLACLLMVVRSLTQTKPPPLWICLTWIGVNGLGIATHYFFVLTLMAEALVLLGLLLRQSVALVRQSKGLGPLVIWNRVGLAVIGTSVTGLVWLPYLGNIHNDELTEWLLRNGSGWRWTQPLIDSVGGWTTMLYLPPIQSDNLAVVIGSAIFIGILLVATVGWFVQGFRYSWRHPAMHLSIKTLVGFVAAAIIVFWVITYGFGRDLTAAFRYNFVFFPAVVVLLGAGLAGIWEAAQMGVTTSRKCLQPRRWQVGLILLVSFLGALVVIANQGYQKTHRPDVVIAEMAERSRQRPVVLAIAHQTHGQTGRLMAIGWDFLDTPPAEQPRFVLAHQPDLKDATPAYDTMQTILANRQQGIDLWMINIRSPLDTSRREVFHPQECDQRSPRYEVDGYKYQLYRCR